MEHLDSLIGKQISNDKDHLKKSLLELPKKGIEILNHSDERQLSSPLNCDLAIFVPAAHVLCIRH